MKFCLMVCCDVVGDFRVVGINFCEGEDFLFICGFISGEFFFELVVKVFNIVLVFILEILIFCDFLIILVVIEI